MGVRQAIPVAIGVILAAVVVALVLARLAAGPESPTGGVMVATTGTTFDPLGSSTTPPPTAAQPPERVGSRPGELPIHLQPIVEVWRTDWSMRTIELEELLVGIPAHDPRDLIRPIDDPVFEDIDSAEDWLGSNEPGVRLVVAGEARFYPLRIMTVHEVVNDLVGGIPVAVTYCPLCNTAAVFDRQVEGEVLRFGVSGLLRNSDLVMWDDSTDSLWQQITGEGIVGSFAGTSLRFVPSQLVRFEDFAAAHPAGRVLSKDQAFGYLYGRNPYVGYSSRPAPFSFFDGDPDPRFPALERVVGVRVAGSTKAYPFSIISVDRAVNDEVAGVALAVWWGAAATADALDALEVAAGRAIGTGVAYERRVGDQILTFEAVGDTTFRDLETGSTWTLLGVAIDGPLVGLELTQAVHQNEFWFAWAAFNEGAPVYGDAGPGLTEPPPGDGEAGTSGRDAGLQGSRAQSLT